MKDWKKVAVLPQTRILDAIEVIDKNALGIVLVTDKGGKLLGTVTDGDVRRAILRSRSLEEPVGSIMNKNPAVVRIYETRDHILSVMQQRRLKHIPVIDEHGCVVSLEILDDMIKSHRKKNWVVLMAGGLGTRLYPLTSECPKPLLKVGDKPILETILESFIEYGFYKFFISVNYKAEMIENYFGDGSAWGCEINYIREIDRLGTAGALSLMPEKPHDTLLVMNGDLLTKVNFQNLLDFHAEHKADATMCVREYKLQIPYGVVRLEQQRLTGIVEKPVQQFFVSAGVYALEPDVLDFVPTETYFDMPNLFELLLKNKKKTIVFPVLEYWMDIGRMGDFERANGEYFEVFNK